MNRSTPRIRPSFSAGSRGGTLLRLSPLLAGLALVLIAAFFGFVSRDFSGWKLWLGAAGVAVGALVFLTGETGNLPRYLALLAYCALTLGSFGLVYLIVEGRGWKWDLTQDRQHSLSPQTLSYLAALPEPIRIVAFTDAETLPRAGAFLDLYRAANPAQVSVEAHDPDTEPLIARSFGDSVYPFDFFVERAADGEGATPQRKKISMSRFARDWEAQLTNAIVGVMRERRLVIYFLEGHGEKPLDPPAAGNAQGAKPDASLSQLRKILEDRAFTCEPLNLLERAGAPDDASLIVLAGPTQDLFEIETAFLRDYLAEGGKLFALLDPITQQGARLPNLQALLRDYGIDAPDNQIVADLASAQTPLGPLSPIVREYGAHQIVEGAPSGIFYFANARPVRAAAAPPGGMTVVELFRTGPTAWVEEIDRLLVTTRLKPPDSAGAPIPMGAVCAASAEGARGQTRLAVFGDSDVFTDAGLGDLTATLFFQTCNWLAQQEDLLAIPPKTLTETPILLDATDLALLGFALGALALGVMFGGLAFTFVRRRMG